MNPKTVTASGRNADFWEWYSEMVKTAKAYIADNNEEVRMIVDILEVIERMDTLHLAFAATSVCHCATEQRIIEAMFGDIYKQMIAKATE